MISLYEIKNLFSKHSTLDYDKASPVNANARGIPLPSGISKGSTCKNCKVCETNCPTGAIRVKSDKEISFDYGACLQCGLCVEVCPEEKLENSGLVYAFALNRDELKINFRDGDFEPKEFALSDNVQKFQKLTKTRGFNFREVAAAGNNTVECEINASFNNYFDSESQAVKSVASPKHADAIIYSGPVSENMKDPLAIAWEVMPEPKALIANGTEAVSGGLFSQGQRPKEPDLFIAGDPPRPDVFINAYRLLMGRLKYHFQKSVKHRLDELKKIKKEQV